jgi:hypothetical protein
MRFRMTAPTYRFSRTLTQVPKHLNRLCRPQFLGFAPFRNPLA